MSDQERLQQLRENAHNQEAKLRRVRALRGQVEQKRLSNSKLGQYGIAPLLFLSILRGIVRHLFRCKKIFLSQKKRHNILICETEIIGVDRNTSLR